MSAPAVGSLVQSFFVDGLLTMKGLRPASVRSYRDAMRLWLTFVAADTGRRITRLTLADFSFERVLRFLQHLETVRHNHIRSRNQRLAMLHTFFAYLATRVPEMLAVAERVAAIPTKRVPPAETRFLEREEVRTLFAALRGRDGRALRDRALLLFLSTSARPRVSGSMAKATSGARVPCGPRPRSSSGPSWRTARRRPHRTPRCSPRAAAARSPATGSTSSSAVTPPCSNARC
jgi:integrase/recombinase XerD